MLEKNGGMPLQTLKYFINSAQELRLLAQLRPKRSAEEKNTWERRSILDIGMNFSPLYAN